LLQPDVHPEAHVVVRLDLAKLHRRLLNPQGVHAASAQLRAALRHLLATHLAFAGFRFPLPSPGARAAHDAAQPATPPRDGAGAAEGEAGTPSSPPPQKAPSSIHSPPPLGGGPAAGVGQADGAVGGGEGSAACAAVAALWPRVECELHGVLKELIRLHGLAQQLGEATL
jgi:hypothetical protein